MSPRISAVEAELEQERKRATRFTVLFVGAVLLLAAAVAFTVYRDVAQDRNITQILREAPCREAPHSRTCKQSITAAVKTCKSYRPCRNTFLSLIHRARRDSPRNQERGGRANGSAGGGGRQPSGSPGQIDGGGRPPANPPTPEPSPSPSPPAPAPRPEPPRPEPPDSPPNPAPPPRDVSICVKNPQLSICAGADLPRLP